MSICEKAQSLEISEPSSYPVVDSKIPMPTLSEFYAFMLNKMADEAIASREPGGYMGRLYGMPKPTTMAKAIGEIYYVPDKWAFE